MYNYCKYSCCTFSGNLSGKCGGDSRRIASIVCTIFDRSNARLHTLNSYRTQPNDLKQNLIS